MNPGTRRDFMHAGTGLLLVGCSNSVLGSSFDVGERAVPATEDLMREHGAHERLLLVYEEATRRMGTDPGIAIQAIERGASLVQRFVEGYHEKLEEEFVFPHFEAANAQTDLVRTLREQHRVGRRLTAAALTLIPTALGKASDRENLVETLRVYQRMARPHMAREDTVLLPAFRSVISTKDLGQIGAAFEDREHALLGKRGFDRIVGDLDELEKSLGINELSQTTPAT